MYRITDGNGNSLRVRFKHDMPNGRTYCILDEDKPIGLRVVGQAKCHPGDMYCKNTGRKVALAKALRVAAFPRTVRGIVWNGYFAKRGKTN